MSKRKGPILITDLASKLGSAPSPSRVSKPAADTDHARNAYGFIAENYKTPSVATEMSPASPAAPHTPESGSNQVQIRFKSGSNQVQKPVQIGFESGSEKSPSKMAAPKSGSESGSTLVQIGFKPGSNRVQFETTTPSAPDVLIARGDQRRILDYFFDVSVNSGDRSTPPLSSAEIGIALQMPQESVRTALKRLLQRGAILRRGFQRGRTGWSSYELSHPAYRELLDFRKSGSNQVQIRFKSGSKSGSESGSTISSSSSYLELENLNTTTSEPELFNDAQVQLSPDWSGVDFASLAEVGFSRAHLIQLAKHGKLSAAEVQDSIHFFAFDLKRNAKGREIKGPPLNFFMGILRKGLPYAPPENYESPEVEARRKYLDGKRRIEEAREAQEREFERLEFAEWRRGLSNQQVAAIVPDVVLHSPRTCEEYLKSHFHENVWPERCAADSGAPEHERAAIRQQIEQSLQEGATS